jgi:ZIP family zinc transporter
VASNAPFALLLALLAGLSTGIGSIIAYFIRKPNPKFMSLILGFSAGVMIFVSFAELLHVSIENIGFLRANIGFFVGLAFIAFLDVFIPHEYKDEHIKEQGTDLPEKRRFGRRRGAPATTREEKRSRLMRAGTLTAIGIVIHNLPEGLVTFSSALAGEHSFGILVAVAIAVHNIPEGISVSIPIREATGSNKRAFIYSFSAGLAEPVGALIGYAILLPFLTPTLIFALMAFAAGVMVYISLDEILPTAHMFGEEHLVIIGAMAGMIIMALSIYLIL